MPDTVLGADDEQLTKQESPFLGSLYSVIETRQKYFLKD